MDFSVSELRFAQKYPFSRIAKQIVKTSALSIDNVPTEVVDRSVFLVCRAFRGDDYAPAQLEMKSLLRNEILAFPVSKLIVALVDRLELTRKYASMLNNYFYSSLSMEGDSALADIALELRVKFNPAQKGLFPAQVKVSDYLRPEHSEPESKLSNQPLSKGNVLLSKTGFARLISDIASQEVRDSIPAKVPGIGANIISASKAVEEEFSASLRKSFSKTDFGEIKPEAFPPCMAKIYSELMAGIKVNHMARFAMATFLNTIGMDAAQIMQVYKSTPNFNEKITRYQVERIAGKKGAEGSGYSCPSCDKMRSYNLCVANCPVSHPVRFYEREIPKGAPEQKKATAN